MVFPCRLNERTVTEGHRKAGRHAQQVQNQPACQEQCDLGTVQGNEVLPTLRLGR
jgi:hypothetical protein